MEKVSLLDAEQGVSENIHQHKTDKGDPVEDQQQQQQQHCTCPHHEHLDMEQDSFSSSMIVLIAKLVIAVCLKFWRACSAGLLILLLIYWLYGSLVALSLMFAAIFGLFYSAQDMLLYHPNQPENSRIYVESPVIMGLPYENEFITTSDGERLNLLIIKQNPAALAQAPTFVFFHGNAGNVGHRLMNAYALFNYCQGNVVLVEYRGFGKSSGRPYESGLYCDAASVLDYVFKRQDLNQQKIYLFGRSLGGAVAVYAASLAFNSPRLAGVIIENTFTSIRAIGFHLFNFKLLKMLPDFCFKNKYPSLKRMKKVQAPTLFLSGLADTLIPPNMMKALFEASGSTMKRMARFEGGTHNETWQCNGYYESILRFTKEAEEYKKQGHSHNSNPSGSYTTQMPFDDRGANTAFNL